MTIRGGGRSIMMAVLLAGLAVGGDTAAVAQDRATPDARLKAGVSARIKSVPLSDALGELSKTSGVKMTADKEVAELKVTVFVRNLPLSTLQRRLSEVLHLSWESVEGKKGAPPSYRIKRSLKDRAEEQELADRGERAFRKGVEDAIAWLSLSPEEQDRKLKENPILKATIQQPGGRHALEILGGLDKSDRDKVFDGGRLEFTPDAIPPALREGASGVLQAFNSSSVSRQTMPADAHLILGRQDAGANSILGIGFSANTPTSSQTRILPIQGAASRNVYPEFFGLGRSEKEYADARRPLSLAEEVDGRKKLEDQFEQLADALNINIVAESYFQKARSLKGPRTRFDEMLTIPKGETTVEAALDRIAPPRYVYWWKTGSVYMAQKRYWWTERARQVPESVLARLREIFKKGRPPSLDDWGEVGTLLGPQQTGIVETEGIASLLGWYEEKQPLLAFYGHLPPIQRVRAFSQTGLPWGSLQKEDQKRLVAWVSASPTEIQGQGAVPWDQVRVFAFANPSAPSSSRSLFRAVVLREGSTEQVLREDGAPGDPPANVRARVVARP